MALLCALFVGYNFYADDFGLWRQHDARRVWSDSIKSKYLMSIRYVPENYENVIIGPSVSEIVDPSNIESFRFYNLSSASANIQRQFPAIKTYFDSAARGGVLLVTLYPYFVNHHGLVVDSIIEKPHQSTLFSLFPVQVLMKKLQNYVWEKDIVYDESHNGRGKISSRKNNIDKKFEPYLQNLLQRQDRFIATEGESETEFTVSEESIEQLKAAIKLAKRKEFQVIAYYYPLNKWDFEFRKLKGDWGNFRSAMDAVLKDQAVIIDFNTSEYDYIRADKSNYRDAHMTERGARLLERALDAKLHNLTEARSARESQEK